VNGIETTAFTWLSATQIRFSVAPSNTFPVRLKRLTPNTARLVDFQNGSSLDADADLDKDSNQTFFLLQELLDTTVAGTRAVSDQFTANGTNTTFALSSLPVAGSNPTVTVNGVAQSSPTNYTISGQTLTFTTPPPPGAVIVVNYVTTSTSGGSGGGGSSSDDGSAWTYDIFTGDGSTPSFTLKATPANLASLDVSDNGVQKVPGTDYLLTGAVVTFLTPPASGHTILVRYGAALPATVLTVIQEGQLATEDQTVFTLSQTYTPGTATMEVYLNGLRLTPGFDYVETDSSHVTLTVNTDAGDQLLFVYGNPTNPNTVISDNLATDAVTTTKIKNGAVTLGKLDSAVQALLTTPANVTGQAGIFFLQTPPAGWLEANGGTIGDSASGATARANADTAALFTALWNDWDNSLLPIQNSSGGASTRGVSAAADFAAHKRLPLPDLRGEFLRGWDHGRGVDSGRAFGSLQLDQNKAHTHVVQIQTGGAGVGPYQTGNANGATINTSSSGGTEARPRNLALLICIKL
jgi:hypothetical protein